MGIQPTVTGNEISLDTLTGRKKTTIANVLTRILKEAPAFCIAPAYEVSVSPCMLSSIGYALG